MRTKLLVLGSTLMMLVVLLPLAASAKRITAAGSIAFTKITQPPASGEAPLTNELVVTTVMSNPGLEKAVAQQGPLPGPIYVLPFFVDEEKGNSGPGNLGTVVALTNVTPNPLFVKVTIRDVDGDPVGSAPIIELAPFGTKLFSIADLLD